MKAYGSTSANVTGSFPLIRAKNASTGTSTDGTPLHSDYLNDFWATRQALLDRVALTPSGSIELYTAVGSGSNAGQGQTINDGAQQMLRAYAANYSAPGEIVFDFVQSRVTDRRVLPLQGQIIDGYLYPDLVYSVWVGSGSNGTAAAFYTCSDAGGTTRATTGLTINGVTMGRYMILLDARGLSPIGVGTNTKFSIGSLPVSPNGGSTLSAYLADMMQGHVHPVTINGGSTSVAISNNNTNTPTGSVNTGGPASDGTNGTPRTGAWTRGPGFACDIGIRF